MAAEWTFDVSEQMKWDMDAVVAHEPPDGAFATLPDDDHISQGANADIA
jgi:hypothetical protein